MQSASRNPLCDESRHPPGEAEASEHLRRIPYSPPNGGGGGGGALNEQKEIIVRAETDAGEEKRSNNSLSTKIKRSQACLWHLTPLFHSLLHFPSWVHNYGNSSPLPHL